MTESIENVIISHHSYNKSQKAEQYCLHNGNVIRIKDIDTFTFIVIRSSKGQRLFIKGLDEYYLHYDITNTTDIILALIDFNRAHTPKEIDFSFGPNKKNKDKIMSFNHMAYPTELVSEQGLIGLFDLVADKEAYEFLKRETGFDYERDFYKQVSMYYADNLEQLNSMRRCGCGEYELRPKSRWLSLYSQSKPQTIKITVPKSSREDETPGYSDWRRKVIQRDKKCVCCGLDKHLEAHHMFGYKENPSLATNEHNGVTLCKFCHKKYHSVYGVKNINPVDFMDFIKRFGVNL